MKSLFNLSRSEKRRIWLIALTTALITIARLIFHIEWFTISIIIIFFVFKELFELGRRRSNSKATWK
jgi:hypothetical protein